MKRTKTQTTPKTYRETLLVPGAARVALEGFEGPCSSINPFLGGTADEAVIFPTAEAAREHVRQYLGGYSKSIKAWEIQTLLASGEWLGCVMCGEIPAAAAVSHV